jgi:hypothetical protein
MLPLIKIGNFNSRKLRVGVLRCRYYPLSKDYLKIDKIGGVNAEMQLIRPLDRFRLLLGNRYNDSNDR